MPLAPRTLLLLPLLPLLLFATPGRPATSVGCIPRPWARADGTQGAVLADLLEDFARSVLDDEEARQQGASIRANFSLALTAVPAEGDGDSDSGCNDGFPGLLADAVHLAQVHYMRRLKILLAQAPGEGAVAPSLTLAQARAASPWVRWLFLDLLAATPPGQVDCPGRFNLSALQLATAGMQHENMKALLAAGAAASFASGSSASSPLHIAAAKGDATGVKLLLAAGANVILRDQHNHTPGHLNRCESPNGHDAMLPSDVDPDEPGTWGAGGMARVGAATKLPDANGWRSGDGSWEPWAWRELPTAAAASLQDTAIKDRFSMGGEERHGGWRDTQTARHAAQAVPLCSRLFPSLSTAAPSGLFAMFRFASQPVIITNATSLWRANVAFTRQSLLRQFGDVDVYVSSIPYGSVFGVREGLATLREFVTYMDGFEEAQTRAPHRESTTASDRGADAGGRRKRSPEKRETVQQGQHEEPMYVFDSEFLQAHASGLYALPPVVLEAMAGEPAHQLFLGPAGSGAPFHFHEDAVNAIVFGSKQWWLLPPGQGLYSKQHPVHFGTQPWDSNNSARTQFNAEYRAMTCQQVAGDMMYVPRGWAHSTRNLAETIGLAVEFDSANCKSIVECPTYEP